MLIPTSEGLESSLSRLSPDDRALIELSMLRGVPDGELATLLRVEPLEVERRRELALERFGETLGNGSAEDARRLLANGNGAAAPTLTNPLRAPVGSMALLAGAALLATILAVVLLSGSDDEPRLGAEPQSRPQAPAAVSPPAASSPGPGVKLQPAAGATKASASARIEGDRLELRVRDLPTSKGGYVLWLYDSVAEAAPVARFEIPSAKISARLPGDYERYQYLDLSREPRDGNPNHSGESVLRVPLERLR
jgi:hypothetical protein